MSSHFYLTILDDQINQIQSWIAGIDEADILRWESWILDHLIRPGYLILATVHLVIWITIRIILRARQKEGFPRDTRQEALSRFIAWKYVMWADFWIRTTRHEYIPDVWDAAILIVIIVFVLGTAIDVMIRYGYHFLYKPIKDWKNSNRVSPRFPTDSPLGHDGDNI